MKSSAAIRPLIPRLRYPRCDNIGLVTSFYVENFGCRATQADGASIEQQFQEHGLARAATATEAQLVVLNTCTVTAAADQDARAAIRRIHRHNPNTKIVVTGCYAQRAPQEIAALAGVAQVLGNSHKHELARIVLRESVAISSRAEIKEVETKPIEINSSIAAATSSPSFVSLDSLAPNCETSSEDQIENGRAQIFVSDIFAHTELLAAPVFDAANDRTRPNLKVQDGCDNRCSFCVIPSVRGHSRSLSLAKVLEEINILAAAGYREVVISGINLGRWGRDFSPQEKFEDLVRAVLAETPLEKLRISSVEPMDWSDELIELVASSARIAKHAHVPMQSGSDAVLRRMHRKYRPWHYREKIEKIRTAIPSAAIGADVMVGFPGETDEEFSETLRLIESSPFTYLHVFTYSARPRTAAASMPGQVAVRIARERNRILREVISRKKLEFMRSFIGREVEAITLHASTEALTDNYLKLRLRGHHEANRWLRAIITDVQDGMLVE